MKKFRQQHRPKKSSLIIGKKAIIEAIRQGKNLERIYLQNNLKSEDVSEIRTLAEHHQIPIHKVPVEKLNGFNITNHEGCVGLIAKVQYQNLQDVISFIVEQGETPLFLMLDGITDIRNIGGIARSAYCMGVHAIIIPEKGIASLNEDAVTTSAGALEKIAICRVSSLMKAVDELHLNGIRVLASEMNATLALSEVDFSQPCAIVMGAEDRGISTSLLKICDDQIRIPMPGDFESLNVSVATGIILYEAMRQRNFAG